MLADLNRLLRDCSRSHGGSCKTHLALPSWHQAFQAPAENASQQQMSANPYPLRSRCVMVMVAYNVIGGRPEEHFRTFKHVQHAWPQPYCLTIRRPRFAIFSWHQPLRSPLSLCPRLVGHVFVCFYVLLYVLSVKHLRILRYLTILTVMPVEKDSGPAAF